MKYEIVKKKRYFSEIINSKKHFKSKLFITFFVFDKSIAKTEIGISVKKTVGIAVIRNKIKRKTKRSLRLCPQHNFKAKLIIICKKDIKKLSDVEIINDLKTIMKEIDLLYNKWHHGSRFTK